MSNDISALGVCLIGGLVPAIVIFSGSLASVCAGCRNSYVMHTSLVQHSCLGCFRPPKSHRRRLGIQRGCRASMGIGIRPDDEPEVDYKGREIKLDPLKSAAGLSGRQMAALGLVGEDVQRKYPTKAVRLGIRHVNVDCVV